MDIESEIRLIQQDISYIRKFIEDDREKNEQHLKSAEDYRGRVIKLEEKVKSHTAEHLFYRWLFGIIITVGIALLFK